jgi:hypothetical protein
MGSAVIRKPDAREEQHAVIRGELARVLSLPEFSGSKRCSDFLAYAVDQTLLGGQESELKERTIAVEVFGRSAGYDTNEDSIVRVTAREVRKRLAQCYLAIGPDHPVRIELKTGSYRAEFHWPEARPAELAVDAPTPAPAALPVRQRRWTWTAAWCLVLPAVFLAGWLTHPRTAAPLPAILRAFWSPLTQTPETLLMCVGTPTVYDISDRLRAGYVQTLPPEARMRPFVLPFAPDQKVSGADLVPVPGLYAGFGNVHTATDLVALMGQMGKPWQIRAAGDVSFAELRMSPAILIGGESNVWTQPLTTELRFYFSREAQGAVIRDRTRPGLQWPPEAETGRKTEDYAIVSRIIDSKTGRSLIFLGGRTQSGTQAAGELVTHAEPLSRALAGAPGNWARMNLQLVIRTQVHGLTPSAPALIALHVW